MLYYLHLVKDGKDEDVYLTLSSPNDFDSVTDVLCSLGYYIIDWTLCD